MTRFGINCNLQGLGLKKILCFEEDFSEMNITGSRKRSNLPNLLNGQSLFYLLVAGLGPHLYTTLFACTFFYVFFDIGGGGGSKYFP